MKVSLFFLDGFLACADPLSNMTPSTSHPGALHSTLAASKTENASLSIKRKNKTLCYSQALRLHLPAHWSCSQTLTRASRSSVARDKEDPQEEGSTAAVRISTQQLYNTKNLQPVSLLLLVASWNTKIDCNFSEKSKQNKLTDTSDKPQT